MTEHTKKAAPRPAPPSGGSKTQPAPEGAPLLAVILVRGTIGCRQDQRTTLRIMRLGRKHTARLLPDTDAARGMCRHAAGYVAWGEIAPETRAALRKARGEGPVYHLSPPRKGFGRKGVKVGAGAGGALGYWGADINDLITRML